MRAKFQYLSMLFVFMLQAASAEEKPRAEAYLITCGPGSEIYSMYGHSALRIVIPEEESDLVYNWGVFDFNTPNFAWKFAKGKLSYMLGVYPYDRFLRDYFSEERWVISQKFNLDSAEIEKLFQLLAENLKPENVKYRYNFYYDDCSSRIRDIIEKAVGDDLLYPPDEKKELHTFRYLTGEYEKRYPWIKLGIDVLIGSPGDKKATFRDRMFLPADLKNGLSELIIRREGKMIPLLADPETVLDFDQPVANNKTLTSPLFVISILLIIVIMLTGLLKGKRANNIMDIFLFTIFSFLALMLIFANFITAHHELKWNLNILWLNPFIIICLISLILNRNWYKWFRVVFYSEVIFLALMVFLPQHFNNAFVPMIIILLLRSSIRADFKWNPFTPPYLTQL
jgi:hypothetical protein